ncbi:hypothetical protein BIW11_12683, partial [Tropilaelaps mercedesae]
MSAVQKWKPLWLSIDKLEPYVDIPGTNSGASGCYDRSSGVRPQRKCFLHF